MEEFDDLESSSGPYRAIGRTERLFECRACGSAVSDRTKHTADHEAQTRTAQQARSADMWTRPIGGQQ